MSTISQIDYVIADGNVWTDDSGEYDSEASLDLLADQILQALHGAYPQAAITVTRENAMGGVRAVQAYSTSEEYGEEPATDDEVEQIAAVADGVWSDDAWYVKAA